MGNELGIPDLPQKAVVSKKDYLDYAWKHFTVIAEQRLKTFNFYIIIVGASMAATASAYNKDTPYWIMAGCGALHMLCASIFFLIDQRSLHLIQIPKGVLAALENEFGWELLTADIKRQEPTRNRIFSYTFAFRAAFALHCLFGFFVIVVSVRNGINSNRMASHGQPPKSAIQLTPQPTTQTQLRLLHSSDTNNPQVSPQKQAP